MTLGKREERVAISYFYKNEDIKLHPFFLEILFISSTSVHFSAKKEVSSKKENSCT